MKLSKMLNSPIVLPVLFFIFVILPGLIRLPGREERSADAISWTDAVFSAAPAACVTGLVDLDTGTCFSPLGQMVIICLMQVGGSLP